MEKEDPEAEFDGTLKSIVFTVHVWLREPQPGPTPAPADDIGAYFRNFGVSALCLEDVLGLIKAAVQDGEPDWDRTDYCIVNFWELESQIRKLSGDPDKPGIWYVAGRSCYTREGADDVGDEVPDHEGGKSNGFEWKNVRPKRT
jgi:hypothetical protein